MLEARSALIVLTLASACALATSAACDSSDGDADGDVDADGDGDGDVDGDGDGDGDSGPDCPVNSGYPCGCDGTQATCDDGSDCLASAAMEHGFCSFECAGASDTTTCANEVWGVQPVGGACVVTTSGGTPGVADHCAILCEYQGVTGPCPHGVDCTVVEGGSICQ